MKNRTSLHMALCEGRHSIPDAIDGAIFPEAVKDMTDTRKLEETAETAIVGAFLARCRAPLVRLGIWEQTRLPGVKYAKEVAKMGPFPCSGIGEKYDLVLYVTGLSVALTAVINVCQRNDIALTLMHYDQGNGGYYPQEVMTKAIPLVSAQSITLGSREMREVITALNSEIDRLMQEQYFAPDNQPDYREEVKAALAKLVWVRNEAMRQINAQGGLYKEDEDNE